MFILHLVEKGKQISRNSSGKQNKTKKIQKQSKYCLNRFVNGCGLSFTPSPSPFNSFKWNSNEIKMQSEIEIEDRSEFHRISFQG